MPTTTLHPRALAYLKRLRSAGRRLPPGRRADLVADIEAHLTETAPPQAPEAEVRAMLDRLSDPEQIVAAAEGDGASPVRRGVLEWCAIVLLLIGGVVVPVLGWMVGAVLLWASRAWTVPEKVRGTLVLPGGLLPAVWLFLTPAGVCSSDARSCGTSSGGGQLVIWSVLLAAVVLPVFTAVYLAQRARRGSVA